MRTLMGLFEKSARRAAEYATRLARPLSAISALTFFCLLPSFAQEDAFLVKDIFTGTNNNGNPTGFTGLGSIVVFSATDGTGAGGSGIELWKSDGSSGGTSLLKNIQTSTLSSSPGNFAATSTYVFFTANDGVVGVEPWVTDGTTSGTQLLLNVNNAVGNSGVAEVTAAGSRVFFTANGNVSGTNTGNELFVTDGTPGGTGLTKNINPGTFSATPTLLTAMGSLVVFEATDGSTGVEPWVSDGTLLGTVQLANIAAGGTSSNIDEFEYVPALGLTFFNAEDVTINGEELWKTDGTALGTSLVLDIRPGTPDSAPLNLTSAGGKLFFAANDGTDGASGFEPWVSDGTPGGTGRIGNISAGGNSNSNNFTAVGSMVFFTATGASGTELYVTDGTPGNFTLLDVNSGVASSSPSNLTAYGNLLFFSANSGNGIEPHISNGTALGTFELQNIGQGGTTNSSPADIIVAGDYLYFAALSNLLGREIYRTDGTIAGTINLTNIRAGNASSNPAEPVAIPNTEMFVFSATNGNTAGLTGIELYAVDYVFPTVDYIDRNDATPTTAASVSWEVRFSEGVSNVDSGDFTLVQTGVSGALITSVTPITNRRYTVTATTGSGTGTLGLNLTDNNSITDQNGSVNPLAGTDVNGSFTGQVYNVDNDPPIVQTIVDQGPNPSNAATVDFFVTFSEIVDGVGVGDFDLTITGAITGATIVSRTPPPPSSSFTVTVNTGSGSGTIRLDVIDNDSIEDSVLNPLGGTGLINGDFTSGAVFEVDKTNPTVQSVTRADTNPTNAAVVTYDVVFNEDVTGVDDTDFTVAATGAVAGAAVTGVAGSGDTYSVTVNTGSGTGTVGLNVVDDDSIVDQISQPLGGAGAGNGNFTGEVYTIDKTAPVVNSIVRSGANPTNAATVDFLVTFSKDVSNVGPLDFALSPTGLPTGAFIVSRTNLTPSTTSVTVDTGTGDGTIRLDLIDDGTIVDAVGNQLGGPGAGDDFTTGEVYDVDKTSPSVQSVARLDSNPTGAATVDYLVTFSEAVDGVGVGDFGVTMGGGVTGAFVASRTPPPPSMTYTVTVNTGSGNGTVRLDVDDNDSIVDASTNALGGAGNDNGDFASGEVYTVDKSLPSVQSIVRADATPTNAASVDYTVTFSEDVTGVDTGDFALTTAGLTGSSVSGAIGGPSVYTVTVTTGAGQGTLRLDVTDNDTILDQALIPLGGAGAGNGDFTSGEVYSVDTQSPIVSSIVRSDSNPSNAATVDFLVTFSENVTGVTVGDFVLTDAGVSGASIVSRTNVTPSTTSVTVNTGTGDGTIRLDLADDDSIQDTVGNLLGGTGAGNGDFTIGAVYDINKSSPTVQSIVRSGANPNSSATVDFLVTFSEDVSGVDVADFSLTTTGVSGFSIVSRTNLTPSTTSVTVNTGTGNGTIRLNVDDDDSIADLATNPLGGAGAGNGDFTGGEVYTIDKTIPSVSSIERVGAASTNAGSVDFTVDFSQDVTGVDVTDFTLTLGAKLITGASVTGVTPQTASTYTVTVNTGSGDGTLRLDLVDDDTIQNTTTLAPLGGAGAGNGDFAAGETFSVDKSVPGIAIGAPSVASTTSGPVDYIVTFTGADSVTLTDLDVNLIATGDATGSISVSGTGTASRTVTLFGISGDGMLSFSIDAGVASDNASNFSAAAGPSATVDVSSAPSVPVLWWPVAVAMLGAAIVTVLRVKRGRARY